MNIPFLKHISWYLVVAMFILAIVPRVEAGFSPSEIIAMQNFDREADLIKIQRVIETKAVKTRLEALGFSQEEVQDRLSQLSDPQLHQLALDIDELHVGGDALGVIIALLVIAILVVLILQLTGHKIIVK